MRWTDKVWLRLRSLLRRPRVERELHDELRFHFEQQIEENIAAGMSPEEAHYAARRTIGGTEQIREECRDMRRITFVENLLQDLRYAVRTLRKNPGFALVAILTVGLGIGATTSLFSIVNAVLLRALPYPGADRLAVLWTNDRTRQIHEAYTSYPTYDDWRRQNRLFADLAFCFAAYPVTLTGTDVPERMDADVASANLFSVLRVPALIGRTFSFSEEQRGDHVVVLSYGLWQRRFGGATNVLGQMIEIGGKPATVIGVMPPSFRFPSPETQLWQPLTVASGWAEMKGERQRPLGVIVGRLRPGVTHTQAQAEMNVIGNGLSQQYPELTRNPDFAGFHVNVVPLRDQITGRQVRQALWVLLGAVVFVLLIACTNVANLLLARSTTRLREMAVRMALGASRARLLGQLLTESIVIAALGGVLGLLMAGFSLRAFIVLAPANLARPETVGLDVSVFFFAVTISVLSGVFFGIAPAWQLSRNEQHEALKEGGRSQTGSTSTRRVRSVLVGTEVACAVLLLCGAGLMLRSFVRLEQVPLGFAPQGVLAFRMVLPPTANESQQAEFCRRVLERLQTLPGVQRVGATSAVFQSGNADTTILVEGRPSTASAGEQVMDDAVSPDYFATLGVPLRRGRIFSHHDGRTAPHVAVINETFARRFWPKGDALGKRFQFGDARFSDPWVTVVGVAGDMRRNGLEREPLPQVFLPFEQLPSRGTDFVVRTNTDPLELAATVRRAIAALDRSVPVYRISTLEQRLAEATAPRRFETLLLALFAWAALILAAIGIYGLIHYAVSQRTPEIGIRVALGASRSEVLILVLREGLSLAAAGLLVGVLGALVLTRTLSSLLYGVTATDPMTFALAPLLLAGVALLACAKPAWQAIHVDPIVALHYE